MIDLIIIAVVFVILAAAIIHIIKAKKSGAKCIGCPSDKQCSHNNKSCSCCNDTKTDCEHHNQNNK